MQGTSMPLYLAIVLARRGPVSQRRAVVRAHGGCGRLWRGRCVAVGRVWWWGRSPLGPLRVLRGVVDTSGCLIGKSEKGPRDAAERSHHPERRRPALREACAGCSLDWTRERGCMAALRDALGTRRVVITHASCLRKIHAREKTMAQAPRRGIVRRAISGSRQALGRNGQFTAWGSTAYKVRRTQANRHMIPR